MGEISFSNHISNKKSAINSKAKLAGVAKHNLRKYHSQDYSRDNITLLYGTTNLMQDVKNVYRKEFDAALHEYNAKQTRPERRIGDYFDHVSETEQDMAVEVIIQCGDKKFWEQNSGDKIFMKQVYKQLLLKLQEYLPDFKIANAVVHFDEASPHMHVVGVPVGRGFKRGLSTKVSKRSVFTPQVLSEVLQDKMRADANHYMKAIFQQEVREKKKGKNHDLTVAEYKVAKEEKIEKLSTDKIGLEADILVLNHKKSTTQKKLDELDGEIESSNIFLKALRQIKQFIQSYLPFAPLIEEFANHVERGADIEAGNSFRGLFTALGELLNSFKEIIVDGLCWFPRLMRWQTSKGEVSPVFEDNRNEGYYYRLKSYMDIHTRQEYPKELIQPEIKPENRTGTIEQLEQNVEAVEKQVQLMGVKMSRNLLELTSYKQ